MSRSNTDIQRRTQRLWPDDEQTLPRYGNQRKIQAQLKVKGRRAERQKDKEDVRQVIKSQDW